jgi:hypothetical protein
MHESHPLPITRASPDSRPVFISVIDLQGYGTRLDGQARRFEKTKTLARHGRLLAWCHARSTSRATSLDLLHDLLRASLTRWSGSWRGLTLRSRATLLGIDINALAQHLFLRCYRDLTPVISSLKQPRLPTRSGNHPVEESARRLFPSSPRLRSRRRVWSHDAFPRCSW